MVMVSYRDTASYILSRRLPSMRTLTCGRKTPVIDDSVKKLIHYDKKEQQVLDGIGLCMSHGSTAKKGYPRLDDRRLDDVQLYPGPVAGHRMGYAFCLLLRFHRFHTQYGQGWKKHPHLHQRRPLEKRCRQSRRGRLCADTIWPQ